MEDEGPGAGVAGAVGVVVDVGDVALAAVEVGFVNGEVVGFEDVAAGVGDLRQGNGIRGDLLRTVHVSLSALSGDGELFWNDVVGVCPVVVVVVNRIGEDEDGVAAAGAGDEVGVEEGELDLLFADDELRGAGRGHVAGAVDGGVGVGDRVEVTGHDGVGEGPVVRVAGAVGVGVVVGEGALPVGVHVGDGVVGIRDGFDLA